MSVSNHFDVILAGGGIMGCAIAYNLLKRDRTLRVLVVERDANYERASTALSDGNTRLQFNLKPNIEMSLYGLEVLSTFAEEFATADHTPAIDFRQQGNLYLVDVTGEAFARQGIATQQGLGCDVAWLDRDQIAAHYPLLKLTDDVVGATFGPRDGSMSPLAVLQGYRRQSIALGATFLEAEIAALCQKGDQMTGLRLINGDVYHAEIVFNVTGAWAPILAEPLGVQLPIQSVNRQVFSVEIDHQSDGILPMLLLPNREYIFHEGGGNFIIGGSSPDDFITYDDFSWSKKRFESQLWEPLVGYLPVFDRLRITNGWAGLYAINTFDHNAILGEWPGLRGYYCANGFSGHGFQQSHAVGRFSAELILGLPHALDLTMFLAQRIPDNKPVYENPSRLI